MKRLCLSLTLSVGLASGAWAADPAPDQARLQEAWQAVAAERNGAPAPDVAAHRLAFAGRRFQIAADGKLLYGGAYSVDPAAQPARIEFRQSEGSSLRGEWKGSYCFEASRPEIIDNAGDTSKPPPTQFVRTSGSGHVLVRFEPR